jgi:hypothetical protein
LLADVQPLAAGHLLLIILRIVNILPGNQTICAGSSASFTATGGTSYKWSTGATTASISGVTAAGTYSVTVTAATGCTSSCSRTLTVNQLPTIYAGADPAAQCREASVTDGVLSFNTNTFSVTASNLTNAVLANPAWTIAPGGNPDGFTVNIVSPNSLTTNVLISGNVNGGSITLRVTANSNATPSCGSVFDDVTLVLNARPLLRTLLGSNFCPNVTTTGSVTLQNPQANVSYQLKDDGNNPIQSPKLCTSGCPSSFTWVGLGDGSYTVEGTFVATSCKSTSGPADVIENHLDEVSITAVPDQCNNVTACVGLSALPAGGTFSGDGVSNGQFCPNGLAPGPYTVTYTYTNTAGCTTSSTTVINVITCQAALCTYTQGYFGNLGGKSCDGTNGGKTTTELIAQSLTNWGGTLTLGANGTCNSVAFDRRMTITNTDAQITCLINKMPGGGPATELSGASTICSFNDLKNGRIHNVLLAQTLALGLNIGIGDPQQGLGDFHLQAGCLYTAKALECGGDKYTARTCELVNGQTVTHNEYENRCFSQALINVLTQYYTPDVSGVFALANDALGNKDCVAGTEHGLSLSEIAGAAGSINEVFDECRISVGWNVQPCVPESAIAPPRITVSANPEASPVGALKISAFPNPFRDQVRFLIQSPVAGQAVLEVYNLAGQKIQTLYNGRIEANETKTVNYKPKGATSAMLIYRLKVGNQTLSGKLIGLTD